MKIKRKVKMNLPQLIEWGFENDVTNKEYVCNEHKAKSVIFNLSGWTEFSDEFSYNPHDTFTVEVEEEITKDTKLPSVLVYDGKYFNALYGLSINDIEKRFIDYVYGVETIHLINGDTHTLIWRDGKLVE